jgi:Sugar fermentation stimulation protein RE domain
VDSIGTSAQTLLSAFVHYLPSLPILWLPQAIVCRCCPLSGRAKTSNQRSGGLQAACLYVIQRSDCVACAPCHAKDPEYGRLVLQAEQAGVQLVAVVCRLDASTGSIEFQGQVPVLPAFSLPSASAA